MAEDRVTTILAVELDAAKVAHDLEALSKQIANIKNDQADLNEQFKRGEVSASDYNKQMTEMKGELSWLQKQQKGLIATTKLLDKETATYSDTLNGQRQKLADMQKVYDQLETSQRESAGGKEFLKALQEQSDLVKELEAETGRHQRNVGNYPKVVQAVIPSFNKLNGILSKMGTDFGELSTKGVKAFTGIGDSAKMLGKAFLTPPIAVIVVVLSALMAAVQKVSEAFKKNDDAMTNLQKAFAIFQPIGDGVKKVFDLLADALGKVAMGVAKVVSWVAGKLSPAYADAAAAAQELVQAQDALQEAERQYTENSAKRSAQVAELRVKATQAEIYSAEQRKAFLAEAIGLEKQNLADQKAIAAERLRVLELEAEKNSDTSDEMKDKIASARAAMYQAEEAYYTGVRRLSAQLTQFEQAEHKKRVDDWAFEMEQKRLLVEAEAATLQARVDEMQKQAQEALAALNESEDEDEIPTFEEMARNYFKLDEEGVEYFKSMLDDGVDYATARTKAMQDQWSRNFTGITSMVGSLGQGFTALADIIGDVAENSEDAARAQKALAMVGIISNQAQSLSEGALAIAQGIRSASAVPWPLNIPAIAQVVATITGLLAGVASTIAQAKQVFSQADAGKYATGGVIGGNSYTGDKLIAHVNSGEGIYTGTQANNLLQEIANNPSRGGLDYERMAMVFAGAVATLPAPVLALKEFHDFDDKVTNYNELASI